MQYTRRNILTGLLAVLAAVALFRPRSAVAAEWPKEAFSASRIDEALKNLYGSAKPAASNQIKIRLASVVGDGTRVPVAVSTTLKRVESISIFIDKNPQPLAAHVDVRQALPYFSTDLKFAGSSSVTFVVKAGGKLYSLTRKVRVTLGAAQK